MSRTVRKMVVEDFLDASNNPTTFKECSVVIAMDDNTRMSEYFSKECFDFFVEKGTPFFNIRVITTRFVDGCEVVYAQ